MPLLVNRLSNLSDKMNLRSNSFSCCSCCCVNLFIDSDPIAIIIIINRKAQKTIFEEHVSSFFQYSFQHVLCRRCAPANNYLCNVCNSDCRFIVSSLGLILPNFCGRDWCRYDVTIWCIVTIAYLGFALVLKHVDWLKILKEPFRMLYSQYSAILSWKFCFWDWALIWDL